MYVYILVLYSLTRATLMSPGQDEARIYIYIYLYMYIYMYYICIHNTVICLKYSFIMTAKN